MDYKQLQDIYWIGIPLITLLVAYLGNQKKNKIIKWLDLSITDKYKGLRPLLLVLGIGLVSYALLGPQQEIGLKEIEGYGSDIYILIDTSKSMLVEDVIPSRIERSKKIAEGIVERLKGDRVGFIPYASSAYIQMPLTDDYGMAKMYLDVIDTDMMGGGGTDVEQAITLAENAFDHTGAKNRVILILSDGEEGDIAIKKVTKIINDTSLKVFTVGVGTHEGGLIPLYDEMGKKVIGYKKDANNSLIMSKLDDKTLKSMALAGHGTYYETNNSMNEVNHLLTAISKLEKDKTTKRKIKEYKQLYQYFLAIGTILLIVSLKLPKGRVRA